MGTSASPPADKNDAKKRRASKACSSCRSRKVRCDVLQVGCPCTKCRIDDFKCTVGERKKRRKRSEITGSGDGIRNDRSLRQSYPEHIMLHRVPHYPFFRHFSSRGHPRIEAQDSSHGVLLPVPTRDQSGASTISDDDLEFLKRKGALDLPSQDILNECVSHYFQNFHPFFPVIDKPYFLRCYKDGNEDILSETGTVSLLLLQAIIFTATVVRPS